MAEAPARRRRRRSPLEESEDEKEPNLGGFPDGGYGKERVRPSPDCRSAADGPQSMASCSRSRATASCSRKDLQELIYAMLTQKQREQFENKLELDL